MSFVVIPSGARFHRAMVFDVFEAPRDDGFAELVHDLVGGPFQVVAAPAGAAMYLHEEGKYVGLPENTVATILAHEAGLPVSDWIAGQVVVVGKPDEVGYDTSVPEALLALLDKRGCTISRRSP